MENKKKSGGDSGAEDGVLRPELPFSAPLNFDYYDGGVTPVEPKHDTGWRVLPYHVLVNNTGDYSLVELRDAPTFRVEDGESYLVRRGRPHRFTVLGGPAPVSIWCHFGISIYFHVDLLEFFELPPKFDPVVSAILREHCRTLVSSGTEEAPVIQLLRRNQAGLALVGALAGFLTITPGAERRMSLLNRLTPALDFMNRHCGDRLTLAEVAARVNLSESRFTALFQQAMKCSPLAYHRRLRMGRAHELLMSSPQKLDAVAQELGFYDVFHFSKQFKRYFGQSPGEYMRSQRDRVPGF